GDDAAGAKPSVGGADAGRPSSWRVALARQVGQHIEAPVRRLAGDDEPAFVGVRARARRRIDGDDDFRQLPRGGFGRDALALDQRAGPERALRLLDDLGEQLLPPDRAALVALGDALEKG